MKIAIIGAGIAGASLAAQLKAKTSAQITVFDKSRGIGGRMSTRYTNTHEFDHGAQFFTARSTDFKSFVARYQAAGVIMEWNPRVVTLARGEKPYTRPWYEPHYVSSPRMNSLCKHLLDGHKVERGVKITRVQNTPRGSTLQDELDHYYGPFDFIASTAPAEQTAALLPSSADALESVAFQPCFALMLPWDETLPNWQAAKTKNSSIDWLCLNHLKPRRDSPASMESPALLLHSTGEWAKAHYETPLDEVKQKLCSEMQQLLAIDSTNIIDASKADIHRWRYAKVSTPLGQPFWRDANNKLAASGDWCLGSTVEDAFTSASALADHIATEL